MNNIFFPPPPPPPMKIGTEYNWIEAVWLQTSDLFLMLLYFIYKQLLSITQGVMYGNTDK